MTTEPARQSAARLCLDCGLCCNGVLFDLVRLQPADNAKALSARGIKIKKRQFFTQPCSALCGLHCTIYEDRPTRCRLFECIQFQQVAKGQLTGQAAKARIDDVKIRVSRIETLITSTGHDNPRKPLAQRYANVLAADPANTEDLTCEMNELQKMLNEHFRVE